MNQQTTEKPIEDQASNLAENQINQLRQQAKLAAAQGDFNQALASLKQASQIDANNYLIHLDLVQIYLSQGLLEQAKDLLYKLPEEAQTSSEGLRLAGYIKFAEIMQSADDIQTIQLKLRENPNDSESLYGFASILVVHHEYEKAFQTLLKLFQIDRGFKDGAAQSSMILLFEMLKDTQPDLVKVYRRELQNLLY